MSGSKAPSWIESRALLGRGPHELLILKPEMQREDCPWEFPGGRNERRESPEACLRRIFRDVFRIDVDLHVGQPPFVHNFGSHSITYRYYQCAIARGQLACPPGAELRWVLRAQLCDYHFDAPTQQVVDWLQQPD